MDLILKFDIFTWFYLSYFPYDWLNGYCSSKSNWKNRELGYNFLIICRYWFLVKHQRIILEQIENSQVVLTLKFCTNYEKIYLIFIELYMKFDLLSTLKGIITSNESSTIFVCNCKRNVSCYPIVERKKKKKKLHINFWFWVYMMKVNLELHHAQLIRYLHFFYHNVNLW